MEAVLDGNVQRIGGGAVGVLTNGPGRTVLMRADIDALPVTELTELPYASTVTTVDESGGTALHGSRIPL